MYLDTQNGDNNLLYIMLMIQVTQDAHIVLPDANALGWCLNVPLYAVLCITMNSVGIGTKLDEAPAECPAWV